MALKFAVGNTVKVHVKFTTNDNGKPVKLAITLVCDRYPEKELQERLEQPDHTLKDFMVEATTGWEAQNFLIDDETGKPAEFSKANLAVLLGFPGLASVAFTAYLQEQAATVKN
jgi:hypothetical protein